MARLATAALLLQLLLLAATGAAAQRLGKGRTVNPAALRDGPGRGPGGYTCSGRSCCDYTCDEASQTCAVSPFSGFWVPKSWLTAEGFESCGVKVLHLRYGSDVPLPYAPVVQLG